MLSDSYSLAHILTLSARWRRPVLIACVAAAVLSSIIALLLPNQYESVAVFYPSNLRTADPDRIYEGQKVEVTNASDDIDRILTLGESQPLAEYIIRKFKLVSVYEIDTVNNPLYLQEALERFDQHFKIESNSRAAVEVTFLDRNNQRAALIANAIVDRIDQANQQLTYENRLKVLAMHQLRFTQTEKEFMRMRDSLTRTRRQYNMYNQERQSRELARRITSTEADLKEARGQLKIYTRHLPASSPRIISLQAQIHGYESALDGLLNAGSGNTLNLEDYAASADLVGELHSQYQDLLGRYIRATNTYEDAKVSLGARVSTLYTVQKAVPAMKKSKPVRWLIVVTSVFITFAGSVVAAMFYELNRKVARHEMA